MDVTETIEARVDALPDATLDALRGKWLGHPLHPVLTDLPIGFWTSSFVLDFIGKRGRRTSAAMIGLGLATAVPTIASGLADFPELPDEKKRTALIHLTCMGVTTLLYALSFVARAKGKRLSGFAFGMIAAAVATVGGYLGGQLVFGETEKDDAAESSAADDHQLRIAI